jgi:hypothetical protein
MVDSAIIFFMSFDTTAINPDTNVVIPPNTNINIKAIGLYSTIYEHLTNKYTPAITKQAACNNDDTGVGPSILFNNHVCNPNCTLFEAQPINIHINIIVNISVDKYPFKLNKVSKFKLPTKYTVKPNPITKKVSPNLFNNNEFNPDFPADIRVNQNDINKYDATPINSHPKNNINKLSPVTNTIIPNVKNDK